MVYKKEGLDVENGMYKVTGIISASKVFKRSANKKGEKTNIVPHPIGYRLENVNTGKHMLVEKSEGVGIIGNHHAVNAYIVGKDNSEYDKETGELIRENFNLYLQPFPAVEEAFTKDDRIVNVFKYDEVGNIQLDPLEIVINKDDCSERLWNIVMKEYESKKGKKSHSKAQKKNKYKEDLHTIKELKLAYERLKKENSFNI